MKKVYGCIVVMLLCCVWSICSFADVWEVDTVYLSDDSAADYQPDYIETGSNAVASASDADYGISLLSSHEPYDQSYSISSTVVQYMGDAVPKLGLVHYVLFRSGQYTYRMYYSADLACDGSVFSSDESEYLEYDTRYYTWSRGVETNFTLNAGSGVVYSDLGDYPALTNDSAAWTVAALAATYILYVILRSMFARHSFRIG